MSHHKKRFSKAHSGVTMIEYTLLAALIALATVSILTTLGAAILAKLTNLTVALVG